MIKKISQSFFSFLYKKKILITTFFGIFLLSAKSALAIGFIDSITNGFTYLPAMLFYAIAYATNFFAELSIAFFGWVATTGSLLSYTQPARNAVIKAGFDVTLSFVNMILVMALIFIALTTILRLKEYETKKLLTRFIIIALIINFSPVICGLAVDASNIVTNYFLLSAGNAGANSTIASKIWSETQSYCSFFNTKWGFVANADPKATVAVVCADCLSQSIMYIIVFFIYLLFALLFLLRIFAIWILVILSPIAFACAVLPATKKFWDEWLNNFISWCMIGMTGGFFVWLGGYMASNVDMGVNITTSLGNWTWLIKPIVPIIFLIIGFSYALKTGLTGASMVSGFVGGLATGLLGGAVMGAKWTGKGAVNQTWGRFASSQAGQKTMSGLAQTTWGTKGLRDRANQVQNPFLKKLAQAGAYGATIAAAPTAWASRKAGAAGLRSGAGQEADIAKYEKEFETTYGKDIKRASAAYGSLGPAQYKQKIALARHLAKTKGGKGFNSLSTSQQKEALQLTQKYNPGKLDDLVEASPQWIVTDLDNDDKSTRALKHSIRKGLGMVDARGNAKSIAAGSRLTTATRKTFSNNLGEFIRKMPTDGFKNISESMADGKSEQSKLFMQSLIENGRSSQVSAMTEGLSGRGTGYIEKALNEQLAATNTERTASGLPALSGTKEYLQQTNPRLHDYFTTGQGKGLISLT